MKVPPVLTVWLICALCLTLLPTAILGENATDPVVVDVFSDDPIHFNMDNPRGESSKSIEILDNGRIIKTTALFPEYSTPATILAHVTIKPIPKDEISVHDKWDRAGSIRLVSPGQPDLEIVKFMTTYGGQTDWTVDVSQLAPVLQGPRQIAAFIDTWVSPAWLVDVSFEFIPDSTVPTYHWVTPIYFDNSFDFAAYADTGVTVTSNITGTHQRVMLYYLSSGHCTDGRGADEFVKKDNVLRVDNTVVYRFQPWRDDCEQFRDINPYTRRWSDGWWSSDYSRSGWCPGDVVDPTVLDLTDHLTTGTHRVGIAIENIRPEGEDEHKGYWRVSAYLVGVTDPVE